MDRHTLKILAKRHLKDAQYLLSADRPSGAYYLAGYAVECALKACIAKSSKKYVFPDNKFVQKIYTHNLKDLVKLAGLDVQLPAHAPPGSALDVNLGIVYQWSEQSRYEKSTYSKAEDLLTAITDPTDGVLQWVRQNW
jgi:hypothetical protein